jgi:hypothetical protein
VNTGVWWGDLREGDHLEDSSVDGRVILKWIFRRWVGGAWTDLAQDRHKWRALVNAVMKFPVP